MKSIKLLYVVIILFIVLLVIIQLNWLLKLKSSIIDSTPIFYGVSLLFLLLSFFVKRRYDCVKLFLVFSFIFFFLGFYEKAIESYFMKSAVNNGDRLIKEIKRYRVLNGEYPKEIGNSTIDNNASLFYRIGIAKEYFFYKREGNGFVLYFQFFGGNIYFKGSESLTWEYLD